jgi:single-stranded DNA-specific DHH superfamily exonuclease
VPDKDADGLTSGAILHTTLHLLGLPEELIHIHVLSKGTTVHDEIERKAMAALSPGYIFILDHGSRKSPPAIDAPHKCLVIDHHWIPDSDSFPQGASFVNACDSPPVATTSLLTYMICKELHEDVQDRCDWLAVVGTYGDLSSTIKW